MRTFTIASIAGDGVGTEVVPRADHPDHSALHGLLAPETGSAVLEKLG
jgi:hypothetical protein